MTTTTRIKKAGDLLNRTATTLQNYTIIPGWQSSLMAGNASFRRDGEYDFIATGRMARRILQRQKRKEVKL